MHATSHVYISIHVPRVGDDLFVVRLLMVSEISIHVPRVGDDWGSG